MKYILLFIFLLLTYNLLAQHKEEAEAAVSRGEPYHDKGDYEGALKRYDSALVLDKDNVYALAEKAYTLCAMGKYDESIEYCKRTIKKHPNEEPLKMLYVTYGTDYDYLKKTDKSIEVYDEGIKAFPDFYLLYFNKGISLASVDRYSEAEGCYQKALLLNPKHPGSHNALGRLLYTNNKKIPALLVFCRFFVLEPQSDRAKEDLDLLNKIMDGNVERTKNGGTIIKVDANSLKGSDKSENNFSNVEMILSVGAALPLDSINPSKTSKLAYRLSAVFGDLKELKAKNHGFYWDYYAPYFIEMKEKNYLETFSHIVFASIDDSANDDWLKSHKMEITDFYTWSKAFSWKQN